MRIYSSSDLLTTNVQLFLGHSYHKRCSAQTCHSAFSTSQKAKWEKNEITKKLICVIYIIQ